MEEFVKYSFIMRPHFHLFGDRFSERAQRIAKEEQGQKEMNRTNFSIESTPSSVDKDVQKTPYTNHSIEPLGAGA